jgi:DNA-binding CsgD family transcriptional regulator
MSNARGKATRPRAIVHKKILDTAASNKEATLEEIADRTNGASTGLVERVLDEYGDPADDGPVNGSGEADRTDVEEAEDDTDNQADKANGAADGTTPLDELSDRQVRTLRAIEAHPNASQRDLAEILGISAATVCMRVNRIGGFDWSAREQFVDAIFEDTMTKTNGEEEEMVRTSESYVRPDDPTDPGTALVSADNPAASSETFDPELAHKVIRACMESDRISEEGELRAFRGILSLTVRPD